MKRRLNMKPIAWLPDDFTAFDDSVYNAKSGTYVPAMYSQMLVLGIASFIVAEAFAIGLKMKEEQDLTI